MKKIGMLLFSIAGTNAYTDGMLSVALTAYVSGKSVHISSADGTCVGGEEKVMYIKLQS